MTIAEVIQRVQALHSKGVGSDESRLTSRHIYSQLLSTRAFLLKQKINKKQFLSQWEYSTIPCLELVEATGGECPCLPPIGKCFLRSKEPLPTLLTNLNTHMVQSVTTIDGSIEYSASSWVGFKYKSGNKYTSKKDDYFIKNNYLYITSTKAARVLTVIGVFEDPVQVAQFSSFCETECEGCNDPCVNPKELHFPCSDELVETIVQMCVNNLLQPFTAAVLDPQNDSLDKSPAGLTQR